MLCVLYVGVGLSVYEGSGTISSAGGIIICVLAEHQSWNGVHDELMGRQVDAGGGCKGGEYDARCMHYALAA